MSAEIINNRKAARGKASRNQYSGCYEKLRIQENMVLYHNNGPVNISGTPYIIFQELMGRTEQDGLIHYWVLNGKKNHDDIKLQKYEKNPRVKFIKKGTSSYFEAFAKAKYIIYDNCLPAFFIKKEGQVCVNAWDETPLRHIGAHAAVKSAAAIWNTQKNFCFCDYFVSPNRYTTEKVMDAYYSSGLFPGTIIEAGGLAGTLRQGNRQEILQRIEKKLNCNLKDKKIILYMPSSRKLNGKYVDQSRNIKQNAAKLQQGIAGEYAILTRLEPRDYGYFAGKKTELLLAPQELEHNELFSIADVLVTDYGNQFFEFLYTGKPIVFFAYDREKSGIDREAYLLYDTCPGAVCANIKQLKQAVEGIANGTYDYHDSYEEFVRSYAPHKDGVAAKRVSDIIFDEGRNSQSGYFYQDHTDKKIILLHVGKLDQIAERELCYHILRTIDYSQSIAVVDGKDIYCYCHEFSKINNDIRIMNSKVENNKSVQDRARLINPDFIREERIRKLFHREFLSMYGGIRFDSIIDTTGRRGIWMNVFSSLTGCEKVLMINQKDGTRGFLKDYAGYMDRIVVVGSDAKTMAVDPRITGIPKQDFIEMCEKNSFNVLFISAFDSTNSVFVNLIRELTARGHHCTVVVKDKADIINNKMYLQEKIPFVEIDEFDMKLVGSFDFVFSAPLKYRCYAALYKNLYAANRFILTFASLFSSIVMGVNPDLALSIGKSKFDEFEENGLRYNQIAIGNPQYDRLLPLKKSAAENENRIIRKVIIIEQGAYPYGKKGKTQLAEVLCQMARNNPEITFTVKPRYLPSEQGRQLHVISEHLYDFIEEKPDNLILLTEPVVMEDIIQDFDAAVTTWSTAYLDAAILGLPIILIEGLDSIDVFNVRGQRIKAAYDRLRYSGCVVHYKVLYQNPLPFQLVEESYLREEIYDPCNPSTPRILELLEFLYRKLIITDQRWKGIHQFEFKDFFHRFEGIPLIDVNSNEYKCRKRLFHKANKVLQRFIFDNRCMGQVMDIDKLKRIWEYPVNNRTDKDEIASAIKQLVRDTEEIKTEFFANHFDLVCQDRILQDYYFQWLYKTHRYYELLTYEGILICPESLYFYKAIILYRKHRYKKGTWYMTQFFHLSAGKECKDLRKDMTISPYLWKERFSKYLILYYLDRYGAYEVIEEIASHNVIYQRDILLYYRVKSYINRGMSAQAVKLYEEYSHVKLKKSKNKGLKVRIRYYAGKFFYRRTEGLLHADMEQSNNELLYEGKEKG